MMRFLISTRYINSVTISLMYSHKKKITNQENLEELDITVKSYLASKISLM